MPASFFSAIIAAIRLPCSVRRNRVARDTFRHAPTPMPPMSKTANPQRQIDTLLREAVALQQNGAYAEAEDVYREILKLRPKHFDAIFIAYALLGSLLTKLRRLI